MTNWSAKENNMPNKKCRTKRDLLRLIDEGKHYLHLGYKKVNRDVLNLSLLDLFLISSSSSAEKTADAIVLLCSNGHPNEAVILLRTLIEIAMNMRWVMQEDPETRVKEYFGDLQKPKLGTKWTSKHLQERMESIGMGHGYYEHIVNSCHAVVHMNASALNYGAVLPGYKKIIMGETTTLATTAQMLGHVLEALNLKYKRKFNYATLIWEQIPVSVPKDYEREEYYWIENTDPTLFD